MGRFPGRHQVPVVRSLGPLDRRGNYRPGPRFLETVLGAPGATVAPATLQPMWSELIHGLDLPESGEILLAGDDVGSVKLPAFGSKRFEVGDLVLVTRGDAPPADASAESTGLSDNQLDLVLLRDAFGSVRRLSRVLREAYRILKPGGGVMITEFDAETLLEARPQQYPQRLLSELHPEVGEYLQRHHPRAMDVAMSLVSTGFRDGEAYTLDFPLGHFTDYQTYSDWVATNGWRGMDQIAEADRQALLDGLPKLMRSIAPAGEFFDVEPVGITRAYKPG